MDLPLNQKPNVNISVITSLSEVVFMSSFKSNFLFSTKNDTFTFYSKEYFKNTFHQVSKNEPANEENTFCVRC